MLTREGLLLPQRLPSGSHGGYGPIRRGIRPVNLGNVGSLETKEEVPMKRALPYVALAAALVQVGVAQSREPKSQAAAKTSTPVDEVQQMEKRYTDALMKKDL